MRLLSARLLVPAALVLVAWGGAHLLTSHNLPVTPIAWPGAPSGPSSSAAAPAVPQAGIASASPAPAASGPGAVPVLPGVLDKLNGDTRDTAIGLYALVQQLEQALRSHLQQVLQHLEPGR